MGLLGAMESGGHHSTRHGPNCECYLVGRPTAPPAQPGQERRWAVRSGASQVDRAHDRLVPESAPGATAAGPQAPGADLAQWVTRLSMACAFTVSLMLPARRCFAV